MISERLAGPRLMPWTAEPGAKLEHVPEGDYGVVRLTAGRFKGYLGLYDDDDDRVAIVYPWGPPPCSYIACRHSSMAIATDAEAERWWSVNANAFAMRRADREVEQHRRHD